MNQWNEAKRERFLAVIVIVLMAVIFGAWVFNLKAIIADSGRGGTPFDFAKAKNDFANVFTDIEGRLSSSTPVDNQTYKDQLAARAQLINLADNLKANTSTMATSTDSAELQDLKDRLQYLEEKASLETNTNTIEIIN